MKYDVLQSMRAAGENITHFQAMIYYIDAHKIDLVPYIQ